MGVDLLSITTLPMSWGQWKNPEILHLSPPLFLLIFLQLPSVRTARLCMSSTSVGFDPLDRVMGTCGCKLYSRKGRIPVAAW